MAEHDIIIITIATMLIILSGYIIYNMLRQSKQKLPKEEEYLVTKAIVTEFKNREENINRKITEIMIKLDLLEKRMTSSKETYETIPKKIEEEVIAKMLPSYEKKETTTTKSIGQIELSILKEISSGPKTSREVQTKIGKSREHTARLLKELYNKGYLLRESKGKYFIYSISERGKSVTFE
ncbi:MAG: hypothetical protein QXJ17_03625 [Nitrososphaeria archaeon]